MRISRHGDFVAGKTSKAIGIYLSLIFSLSVVHAASLKGPSLAPTKVANTYVGWIAPNEDSPVNALPVLRHATPGVYVAVGTERGFIGGSLTPGITDLILFDYNEAQVLFNGINSSLIAAAKDRKDYLALRFANNHQDWLSKLPDSLKRSETGKILEDPAAFEWWKKVRSDLRFSLLNEPPSDHSPNHAFSHANYLHYDDQFQILQKLAKEGRIKSVVVDLTNKENVDALAAAVKKTGHPLAVLDLSNLWDTTWFGENEAKQSELADIIGRFSSVSKKDSMVLFTTWNLPTYRFDQRLKETHRKLSEVIDAKDYVSIEDSDIRSGRYFKYTQSEYHAMQMSEMSDHEKTKSALKKLGSQIDQVRQAGGSASLNGQELKFVSASADCVVNHLLKVK